MTGTLNDLVMATIAFVGGHFLLSAAPLRGLIADKLGDGPFRGLYSLVALASFVWMLMAYGAAPYVELWYIEPARHITMALVLLASILIVCGLTTPSPTRAGMEASAGDPNPLPGIGTITRHPFLWGTTLWSVGHLLANGDEASVVLFGGILILSLGGMLHIDRRREAALGAAWGPVALTSSAIPFLAAIQGRCRIDWKGIGLLRLIGGIAVYVALAFGHPWIAGVPLM